MPPVGEVFESTFVTSNSETNFPESPPYHNGIPVAQNEPEYLSDLGYWRVIEPGGFAFSSMVGMQYWSNAVRQVFMLQRESITGSWEIEWLEEPMDEDAYIEWTDYVYNEPFEYNDRWYVVLNYNNSEERMYDLGSLWFSESEDCEYRLARRTRFDLFGSNNGFRIDWIDHDSRNNNTNDSYSVERDDIDVREIDPVLATNIGRDVPLISIEQEFSGNGDLVARTLYEAGLAYSQYPDGYHMSEARHNIGNTDKVCYVETDSSCGYELIFSKVNLKNRIEAEKISEAQAILRKLKDEGNIRLSARCGLHTHVDVSDWGMKEIVSGYHLWNYLEDTVFRFSSAFWATHRDEEVGGGYSTPVPKGYTGRANVANAIIERRDALNFSHILRAKSNCRCGASIYEDWANCTCNLAQPTLEFRVFNATMNPRKIRAYLAFSVAFVNIAKNHEHTPEIFPEMRWRGTNLKEPDINGTTWEERSKERMNYILKKFPLTNAEKNDITYCFRNSSLESVIELL